LRQDDALSGYRAIRNHHLTDGNADPDNRVDFIS